MANQLNNYINNEGLSNFNQSAYKRLHSTETAVLKIKSDIAASIDSGKAVALTLLDPMGSPKVLSWVYCFLLFTLPLSAI